MKSYKAISLWQPWATLWGRQVKRLETRSWATSYSGPLAIHAAKKWDEQTVRLAMQQEPFRSTLKEMGYTYFSELPRGSIIAVCDGVLCYATVVALHRSNLNLNVFLETAFGDFTPGRFAWEPINMRMLKTPIPCRGYQQLWDVPAELVREIEEQL